jgi:hypothetical protein
MVFWQELCYGYFHGEPRARGTEEFMRTRLLGRYSYHRGFAFGLVIALLAFAFLCPVMLPALCSGSQQTCQSQPCWLLVSGTIVPLLIVFAWLLWTTRCTLLREHPVLLFRPPRPCLP